jgi:hypothetical protein
MRSLFVYMLGLSLSLFGTLPYARPLQNSVSGNPTSYQPKIIPALLLPAIYIVTVLVGRWLVKIPPVQYPMPNSQATNGH